MLQENLQEYMMYNNTCYKRDHMSDLNKHLQEYKLYKNTCYKSDHGSDLNVCCKRNSKYMLQE